MKVQVCGRCLAPVARIYALREQRWGNVIAVCEHCATTLLYRDDRYHILRIVHIS
jgi:hypothetical protein